MRLKVHHRNEKMSNSGFEPTVASINAKDEEGKSSDIDAQIFHGGKTPRRACMK